MDGVPPQPVVPGPIIEAPRRNKTWIVVGIGIVALLVLIFAIGPRLVASYYLNKGEEQLFSRNFETAKSLLEHSLTFNSKNPVTHAYLARAHLGARDNEIFPSFSSGNVREAIAHYEDAFELGLESGSKTVYLQSLSDVAHAYWSIDERDKAVEKYLEKINKDPQDSFWPRYIVASEYFNRLNKPDEAIVILLPAKDSVKDLTEIANLYKVFTLTARIYSTLQDRSNAEIFAKLALENNPLDDAPETQIAHNILALAAGTKGDFVTAEKEIKIANELSKMPDSQNCVLAYAYYLGKNYTKAIAQAKNIPGKIAYVDRFCPLAAGRSYFDQKKKTEARQYLEEYLRMTESLEEKNASVVRQRNEVSKMLEGL